MLNQTYIVKLVGSKLCRHFWFQHKVALTIFIEGVGVLKIFLKCRSNRTGVLSLIMALTGAGWLMSLAGKQLLIKHDSLPVCSLLLLIISDVLRLCLLFVCFLWHSSFRTFRLFDFQHTPGSRSQTFWLCSLFYIPTKLTRPQLTPLSEMKNPTKQVFLWGQHVKSHSNDQNNRFNNNKVSHLN